MTTEIYSNVILQHVLTVLKLAALIGFLVCTTLIINLNHRAFNSLLNKRASSLWWLFLLLSIIPFVLIIFVFNFFFQNGIENAQTIWAMTIN